MSAFFSLGSLTFGLATLFSSPFVELDRKMNFAGADYCLVPLRRSIASTYVAVYDALMPDQIHGHQVSVCIEDPMSALRMSRTLGVQLCDFAKKEVYLMCKDIVRRHAAVCPHLIHEAGRAQTPQDMHLQLVREANNLHRE